MREAAQTLAPGAGLAVVSPEDVGGADQPVLVRGVELERVAVAEDAGPADQRHVVEVHHVDVASQQPLDRAAMDHRPSELVGEQRREEAERAAQRMDADAVRVGRRGGLEAVAIERAVGVDVVDHIHAVAGAHQRLRHVADQHGVAPEVVRGIEGGGEDEAEHRGGVREDQVLDRSIQSAARGRRNDA